MKQNLKVFGELPAIIFKNKGLTLSIGNRKKFLFKTKGKYKAAFILFCHFNQNLSYFFAKSISLNIWKNCILREV